MITNLFKMIYEESDIRKRNKRKFYQDLHHDLPPYHPRHLKPYYNGTPIEQIQKTKKIFNYEQS